VRAGKKPYSLHRITFDDAVDQGLCRRVFQATRRAWSPQAQLDWCESIRRIYRPNDAEELDVVPSSSSGAYMSRALIEQRMSKGTPVLRFACPKGFEELPDDERAAAVQDWIDAELAPLVALLPRTARSSVGMDFGRSGDLSVIVPLLEDQGLKRTCPFTVELRNVPFRQQEQILFWLADHLPRFCFGALDARGNGQYLAEVAMQRYGSASIAQVMLSNPWYLENFPKFKAALEDGTLDELPLDRDTLDDLRCVVVDKGIPKIPDKQGKGADGGQRHGDAAVAFCLAWFASNQGGGPIEYIEVPLRRGSRSSRAMLCLDSIDAPEFDSRRDW
jgi:phage FluMu gp28-like protein